MTDVYLGPATAKLPSGARIRRKSKDLPRNMVPIIGIDPGETTGWSMLVLPKELQGRDIFSWNLDAILRHKLSWQHGEIKALGCEDDAVNQLYTLIDSWPSAAVVVEDFILRAERKEKSRNLLSPVRITAKLETYLWRNGRRMFLQQASQAKTTITDDRLTLWGSLANDGLPDHARDADRHAVLFLRRCLGPSGVGVKRMAWPHLYLEP